MERILFIPSENTKVIVNPSPQTRSTNPKMESAIDTVWQRKKGIAKRTSRALWDSPTYRLSSWETPEPNTLVLNLGETTYKETLGTHEAYPRYINKNLGPEYFANTIVVTGSLITSDGIFVIGERSKGIIESGKYGTLGGSLDKKQDKKITSMQDIAQAFQDEIEEEIGIKPQDITSVTFIGLTQDAKFYPQLHFIGKIPHPFSWIKQRFIEQGDEEHLRLIGIPITELAILGPQYMNNGSGALRTHLLLLAQRKDF